LQGYTVVFISPFKEVRCPSLCQLPSLCLFYLQDTLFEIQRAVLQVQKQANKYIFPEKGTNLSPSQESEGEKKEKGRMKK